MSEMLQRTLGEQIQIETVLAGGLWRTLVDPGELENALLNLCVNARDAMPDGRQAHRGDEQRPSGRRLRRRPRRRAAPASMC